jgi:hypothetical protein
MCMTVNIDKMKVMIIKSQKTTYDNFLCEKNSLAIWDKKKIIFYTLVTHVIFYGCEVSGSNISKESWRKIEQIQNNFITYNPKIKGNIHDHILLIEAIISINSTQNHH